MLWQHFFQEKYTSLHLQSVHYQIGYRVDQGRVFSPGAHTRTPHPRAFSKEGWLHFTLGTWVRSLRHCALCFLDLLIERFTPVRVCLEMAIRHTQNLPHPLFMNISEPFYMFCSALLPAHNALHPKSVPLPRENLYQRLW